MSRRLRRFLMNSPTVYGIKWFPVCGNWTVFMFRKEKHGMEEEN